MSTKRLTTLLLALCVTALFIFSGCSQVARKPGPTQPVPNQNQTDNNTERANKEARTEARNIAREADLVDGVKSSTVVVAGNTAYIGLDIKSDIEREQTRSVEEAVIKRVRGAEADIDTVFVSSDPDTVTRLKNIDKGIAEGMPVSSFANELGEIARRLSPRTM
ncbi:YhcN/YlaJ family sporulation lipoprotein [Desulfoscipio gibsoniae]|uniref:Sporulation lipoprotein, YhcN/YlaJ family n=1 Tax=Desulfoscipio gibsoniae DSM 7213 TaxID=767817 RepID=R4KLE0_9FIRM|nr:YhcN/YlaJ family sporulation lipoprotein [Desulfoscipio gibsoniae]AGL00456.1 sporulation lipoprotein, YhcN/YlaJ family [Desulfoscipio gibsoniae DSM 7213]